MIYIFFKKINVVFIECYNWNYETVNIIYKY